MSEPARQTTFTPPPLQNGIGHLLQPLSGFYATAGQSLPEIHAINGSEIPEPYRALLVHECDMTPTLETYHGGSLNLEVLGRRLGGDTYSREVLLRLEGGGRPVEFGAICIHLELFGEPSRQEIRLEQHPLGHILQLHRIPHSSHPGAFLRILSDDVINGWFGLQGQHTLYGRCNTLLNPEGKSLAEVVEILPP